MSRIAKMPVQVSVEDYYKHVAVIDNVLASKFHERLENMKKRIKGGGGSDDEQYYTFERRDTFSTNFYNYGVIVYNGPWFSTPQDMS